MKTRMGGAETTAAALIVLGVVIGAGMIYGTLSLTGRSLVSTSTEVVTTTITSTMVVTTTTTPAVVATAQVQAINAALVHQTSA